MTPLTTDQRDLLDLVRSYAGGRLAPRAAEDERAGVFPRDLLAELGSMDLMGLPFPEELGGSGQPYGVYLRVVEELARAFLSVGLSLSVHTLATWGVLTHAPAPLRDRVAHRMTAGEWLGAYSLSEPASGSDAASLSTRAVRDGDAYVVNGTKAWVTHAGEADFYLLLCRTDEHRTRGVSALYVPADTPGLSFAPPERKMGLRSSPTRQVRYDDARVPAAHLLGREGEGLGLALRALDSGRLGIAACAVGLAQCALEHAVAHARGREQFGRPIGDFQGVGFMLADMATRIAAARALYLEAAARRDAGDEHRSMAAMAKLFATDTAMAVTVDAVQVLGGYGYVTDYPVERLMREAKALQIVEGTNQIQRLVVSRGLLGNGSAVAGA
ncbi:MAG: acyl-CoA dehydrogenase family protein [Actinobacteria bacterium]|nr:acyl-CoA dehydrogenase family protein [Actinomycetota bacterium]